MHFRTVTLLSLLGLIPILVFTIMIMRDPEDHFFLKIFYTYSAIVLSFLGGMHWGVLTHTRSTGQIEPLRLYWIWSVVPPIVGWFALLSIPVFWNIAVLMVMYVLQYLMDTRLTKKGIFPYWLLQLRRLLTLVVIINFIAILLRLKLGT